MKQFFLALLLLWSSCVLSAQVTSYEGLLMGSASFHFYLSGSDTVGTIVNFQDQTALGFKLSDIEKGDVLLSSNGSMWSIDSIVFKNIVLADVHVARISSFGINPTGNGYVGRPSPNCKILPNTYNLSSKQQAELANYNARAIDDCMQGGSSTPIAVDCPDNPNNLQSDVLRVMIGDVEVSSGAGDPSGLYNAPRGSLYMDRNGYIYYKTGSTINDWTCLLTGESNFSGGGGGGGSADGVLQSAEIQGDSLFLQGSNFNIAVKIDTAYFELNNKGLKSKKGNTFLDGYVDHAPNTYVSGENSLGNLDSLENSIVIGNSVAPNLPSDIKLRNSFFIGDNILSNFNAPFNNLVASTNFIMGDSAMSTQQFLRDGNNFIFGDKAFINIPNSALDNIAIGREAGYNPSTDRPNSQYAIAIGTRALKGARTFSNSIAIGRDASVNNPYDNTSAFGPEAAPTKNSQIYIGSANQAYSFHMMLAARRIELGQVSTTDLTIGKEATNSDRGDGEAFVSTDVTGSVISWSGNIEGATGTNSDISVDIRSANATNPTQNIGDFNVNIGTPIQGNGGNINLNINENTDASGSSGDLIGNIGGDIKFNLLQNSFSSNADPVFEITGHKGTDPTQNTYISLESNTTQPTLTFDELKLILRDLETSSSTSALVIENDTLKINDSLGGGGSVNPDSLWNVSTDYFSKGVLELNRNNNTVAINKGDALGFYTPNLLVNSTVTASGTSEAITASFTQNGFAEQTGAKLGIVLGDDNGGSAQIFAINSESRSPQISETDLVFSVDDGTSGLTYVENLRITNDGELKLPRYSTGNFDDNDFDVTNRLVAFDITNDAIVRMPLSAIVDSSSLNQIKVSDDDKLLVKKTIALTLPYDFYSPNANPNLVPRYGSVPLPEGNWEVINIRYAIGTNVESFDVRLRGLPSSEVSFAISDAFNDLDLGGNPIDLTGRYNLVLDIDYDSASPLLTEGLIATVTLREIP